MKPQLTIAFVLGALCIAVAGLSTNSSTTVEIEKPDKESTESNKERFRRLIPYMTFYFSQQQYGDRPNFQQISGAGHVPNANVNNLFTQTQAPYTANGNTAGAHFSASGPTGGAQYSTNRNAGGAPFPANNIPPSGTVQYTSNNIAAFLASYLTKQANNGATLSNNQHQNRYSYPVRTPSLSYSTNNIVATGSVPYNTGTGQQVGKSIPFTSNDAIPAYAQPIRVAPASAPSYSANLHAVPATAPTYPANHAPRPTDNALYTSSNHVADPEQNYATTRPVAGYLTPSQVTVAAYRPVDNRPSRPIVVNPYRPPVASQQSAADTLSQILDLLRAAGRLPPLEDAPVYTQLPATPLQDPALYRVPSTTPLPKPIQSLDEDDYAYYDDDVDIQKPAPPSAKPAPFQVAPKIPSKVNVLPQNFPPVEGGTPGRPGVDYPILYRIPETRFDCKTQRYKGFFGDPETNCQVWHYCDLNGGQASFLCPNGTIFSQVGLTCDWWFNVKCDSTVQLYVLNERLYKYILPVTPSFPEDYHGPVVDRYLELKFREKELKEEEKRKQATTESSTTT